MSVKAAVETLTLNAGDVAILNDPFCGGTHLPDITLVAPVFVGKARQGRGEAGILCGITRTPCGCRRNVCRIDGHLPRDLPGRDSHPSHQADGRRQAAGRRFRLVLNNVRTPEEREGDLNAQIAACHTGAARLLEITERYGWRACSR